MWSAITVALTSLLPMLIKLVLYIIEKKENGDKLREEMLRVISSIEKDVPINLHDKYQEQLNRIRDQIAKNNTDIKP